MSQKKILSTRSYRLFERSDENRPLDPKKHRKLQESMQKYGFLRCFPIVVKKNDAGHLIIKDGQHRLLIAEKLGLEVWWVEEDVDFDIAVINCTSRSWTLKDFAEKFKENGKDAYAEGLDFSKQHGLPIGTAFALLAGVTSFNNCQDRFTDGTFVVNDRVWADAVAGIYGPMALLAPCLKNARFISACMAVCRVDEFDPRRLLECARRRRDLLTSYSTRDAYLDMMEEVYNYGRAKRVALKQPAIMAMRERVGNKTGKKKADEEDAA